MEREGGRGGGRRGKMGSACVCVCVTYLHHSAAFLLIKTPICVFEVHNESVWLRGGTRRK